MRHRQYLHGKPRFVLAVHNLVRHRFFDNFIIAVVITNTVTLAITHYGMSSHLEWQLSVANLVFTFIFVAELVLKLIGERGACCTVHVHGSDGVFTRHGYESAGLGYKQYFRSLSLMFDFFIVVSSVVEIAVGAFAMARTFSRVGHVVCTVVVMWRWTLASRVVVRL